MLKRLFVIAFVALPLAHPPFAQAQSNVEVNAGIQFDFLNPGARSLALGSAFTAIADDATTAFTNPAGLRALSRPEISVEGRFRNFETPFTVRGRASGTPLGRGIDTISGLVDANSQQTIGAASFISFVYPSSRWAVAAYRHEVARFKSEITTEGAIVETLSDGRIVRLLPVKGSLDLKVVDYGVSGSFRLGNRASVGAGVVVYDFSEESLTTRYDFVDVIAPPTFSSSDRVNFQTQSGSDRQVGVNVGIAAKPTDKVQVGAVFRRGAAFDVRVANTSATTNNTFVDRIGKFRIPDIFSAGVMVSVTEPLRIAVDFTRVQYSQLTKNFVDVFGNNEESQYTVDDGNEIHVGAEYLVTGTKVPVAFRGGFWYDPAHSLRYVGSDRVFQTIFRERDDAQMHYTGGAGFALPKFELNVGVDISKAIKTTSVSTVVRF